MARPAKAKRQGTRDVSRTAQSHGRGPFGGSIRDDAVLIRTPRVGLCELNVSKAERIVHDDDHANVFVDVNGPKK